MSVPPGERGFGRVACGELPDGTVVYQPLIVVNGTADGTGPRSIFYVDIGTATENMLLAAEAVGLRGGPVTSFSKEAVSVLLRLPSSMTPELIVILGSPAPRKPEHHSRPRTPTRLEDLVTWEQFPPQR